VAFTDFSFSKLTQQKRDAPSVQKLSLRLLKSLHQLSKRNGGTINGQLVILGVVKNLGRLRRKRKRRKDVKKRMMLKREMNHDCISEVLCVAFSSFLTSQRFEKLQ
jgi:malonyl CoA-acyl carrier protein transacylase